MGFFCTLILSLLLARSASADISWFVGGGLGVSHVSFEDIEQQMEATDLVGNPIAISGGLGHQVSGAGYFGMVFQQNFSVGIGVLTQSKVPSDTSLFYSVTPLVLDLTYYPFGTLRGPFVSLSLARVVESVTYESGDNTVEFSDSENAVGARIGYNFQVLPHSSLGPEIRYLKVNGDPSGSDYEIKAFNVVFTYWWGKKDTEPLKVLEPSPVVESHKVEATLESPSTHN